jgi:hypothetical protein
MQLEDAHACAALSTAIALYRALDVTPYLPQDERQCRPPDLMHQGPQPGPTCTSAMGPLVQRGYLWSQPYRVVKGPRRDHRPDADLASAPGHAAPGGTRGNDPTHRGRLLFATQSVAVALRLSQLD